MKLPVRALRTKLLLGAGLLLAALGLYAWLPVFHASPAVAQDGEWQTVGLQGTLVHHLALAHRDRKLMFAGASGGLYRYQPGQGWRRVLRSAEVWDVAVLPDDTGLVAADNDGNADLSHDRGTHWRRVMVAPGGAYALTVAPDNPGRILFGAAGGVYLSRDGGLHWQRRLALPNSAGAAFAWQPGSSRVVFAGAVAGAPRGSIDVFVSRDAGSTWHVFGHDLKSLSGIMSLHVTAGEDVYAGTMGNATWTASLTRGAWRKVAAGMPGSGDHVASIAGVPGHSRTLFVGTLGFGVFRTTDGGRHWVNLSRGLSKAHNAWIVLSVVYAPLQHALFAGTADGVYELKLS